MVVKEIQDEDFINYKKPSMFIAFPSCSWKCEKECGKRVCQNSALAQAPNINIEADAIVERYLNNPITHSIVIGGLEPFDSRMDLYKLIQKLRQQTKDTIIIYTGYNEDEVQNDLNILSEWVNIIIKFGRFVPNQEQHYDEVLGIELASPNQYARRIS